MTWRWVAFELAALAALSFTLPDALGVAYVDTRLRVAYAAVAAVVASSFVLQSSSPAGVRCRRGAWAGLAAFLLLMALDTLRIGRASYWQFLGWEAGPLAGLCLLALSLARLGAAGAVWAAGRLGSQAAPAAVWGTYLVLGAALIYGAPPRLHFVLLAMTQPESGQSGVLLAFMLLASVAGGAWRGSLPGGRAAR
ncbi:MAG: hypothetical protein IT162_19020 [Bryobacterales bacterium]|nr:hypothetical protein [Bryobacterales bacterium]